MRILIVGTGDIGFQLSKKLCQDHHDVVIVENDQRRANWVREQLDAIVVDGNGASNRLLVEAGVAGMDVVAAMTTVDEVNLMICRLAKAAGVEVTVARVRNPEYMSADFVLSREQLGVDLVIHPEKETAEGVSRLIKQSQATSVVDFEQGKIRLLGIRLPENSQLLHVPLAGLWKKHGFPPVTIAAIERKGQTLIPRGNNVLLPDDQVFAFCAPDFTADFVSMAGRRKTKIENVMILGGGLIGRFLTEELSDQLNVRIIESNVQKSWEIADSVPGALVIQGDGTDFDLLASEGILDMDAFIAVTGDDETNIISTLLARHLHVPRTVALVNKVEYLPITSSIGMDAVISKELLTVNAVMRYVHGRQVAAIASLPGLDAQCTELVAQEGSKVTKKPIQELRFPKSAVIGAFMRGDRMVVARGDSRIMAGDKALVMSKPQSQEEVERLFRN